VNQLRKNNYRRHVDQHYPLQGSSFQWERLVNSAWSTLQPGAKYGNVNTISLIIYNVDPRDDGSYSCAVGSQKRSIQFTVSHWKDDPCNGHVNIVVLPDMASTEISPKLLSS
jgi:hypothetical protein